MFKDKIETAVKSIKPPENLPVEDFEVDIDIHGEMARTRAAEIGLKGEEEIEFFVDVAKKEVEGSKKTSGIFEWARGMVEKTGDFRESIEWLEYFGSSPFEMVDDRKEYKEFAERARYLVESKRDASLPPFDERAERKKLREQRKKIVEMVKSGEITREAGLEVSRADFEEFKRERDWQREGMEYFKERIFEDMLGQMRTSAGVSALEGRMILENEKELKKYIEKYGEDAAINILEVPVGDFDSIDGRNDFVRALDDEIDARTVFYRFTEEQTDELKNHVFGSLVEKRADLVGKMKKGLNKNNTLEEITGVPGLDRRKMKIIPTAFAFYIRCEDVKDYAALYKGKPKDKLTEEEIEDAEKSGGFYREKNYLAEKNTGKKKFGAREFRIFNHEEQHFFDQIFQGGPAHLEFSIFLDYAAAHLEFEEAKTGKKDFKQTELEVGQALRGFRKYWEWRAASEFLAYFRQGSLPEDIYEKLITEKRFGGIYDYFDEEKCAEIYKHITENFSGMGAEETNGIIRKILAEEYMKILKKAEEALDTLQRRYLSRDQIISFFQKLPPDRWLPATKKILKNKKEKEI